MENAGLRTEAVNRFLQGASASAICRTVHRSRRWFYKWLKRYDPANPGWAEARSRAPKRLVNKTAVAMERTVCEVRRRLVNTRYSQHGALAIQWQLKQLGARAMPTIWTINRILRRHGLVTKPAYVPRGTPYPAPAITGPNDVHQLDVVGPRYLTGGKRFYGIHCIDAYSNAVALTASSTCRATEVAAAVVAAWRRLGVPRMLQVDNSLAFRGSNLHPRSLGLLIRLCLCCGVELVFIPESEPWRNGVVERFNDVYDKLFFRSRPFADLPELSRELPAFEHFHNRNHRYAKLDGQTPWHVHRKQVGRRLRKGLVFDPQAVPWREGRVSFIRLTDSHGMVRFFAERFAVDTGLIHEYVKGTIDTKSGRLTFTHQGRLVKTLTYAVTKPRQCNRSSATFLH
jgi:transposase InsO family protein